MKVFLKIYRVVGLAIWILALLYLVLFIGDGMKTLATKDHMATRQIADIFKFVILLFGLYRLSKKSSGRSGEQGVQQSLEQGTKQSFAESVNFPSLLIFLISISFIILIVYSVMSLSPV